MEERRALEALKVEAGVVSAWRSLEERILEILEVGTLAGVSAETRLADSEVSALASAAQWGRVPC